MPSAFFVVFNFEGKTREISFDYAQDDERALLRLVILSAAIAKSKNPFLRSFDYAQDDRQKKDKLKFFPQRLPQAINSRFARANPFTLSSALQRKKTAV